MEWCLDCHRAPGDVRAPAAEVFNIAWTSRRPNQLELGRRARPEYGVKTAARAAPRATDEHEKRRRRDPGRARARPRGEWPARGRYWRSLEELPTTPGFRDYLQREFPEQASDDRRTRAGRREFLQADGRLARARGPHGLHAAAEERILPYVRQPEGLVPGRPLFFATALAARRLGPRRAGREPPGPPTKIEGNPDHPASLGATDVFAPGARFSGSTIRIAPRRRSSGGEIAPGRTSARRSPSVLAQQEARRGAGSRILTDRMTSPTLAAQMRPLLKRCPRRAGVSYEPVSRDNARAGAQLAFGEPVEPHYHLDQADVVLSLEADFLTAPPGGPAARPRLHRAPQARRPTSSPSMNRLYVVESTPTLTGAPPTTACRCAARDRGLRPRAGRAARRRGRGRRRAPLGRRGSPRDLGAGRERPRDRRRVAAAAVHALAHAINETLGNVGTTVVYTQPVERGAPPDARRRCATLVATMRAGRVEVLLILAATRSTTRPADLDFARRSTRSRCEVHLGLYDDETLDRCHWHMPAAHSLESWGDARAFDGTVSIAAADRCRSTNGRRAIEVLAAFDRSPSPGLRRRCATTGGASSARATSRRAGAARFTTASSPARRSRRRPVNGRRPDDARSDRVRRGTRLRRRGLELASVPILTI